MVSNIKAVTKGDLIIKGNVSRPLRSWKMADIVGLSRLLAFIAGLFGLLFLVIATPTHHWFTFQTKSNETTYGGIWENCKQFPDGLYSCLPLPATGMRS